MVWCMTPGLLVESKFLSLVVLSSYQPELGETAKALLAEECIELMWWGFRVCMFPFIWWVPPNWFDAI